MGQDNSKTVSDKFVMDQEKIIRRQLFDVPDKDRVVQQAESEDSFFHIKTDTTGSCMFHAVALWLTYQGRGRKTKDDVRQAVVNYLERNRIRDDGTDRANFIDPAYYSTDWDVYLFEMRKSKTWGDAICLQACHELYYVDIVLHQTGQRQRIYKSDKSKWPAIHLGFEECHYYAFFPLPDDPDERENMRNQIIGIDCTTFYDEK